MQDFIIPQNLLEPILTQARESFPQECCGVILGKKDNKAFSRLYPCRNAQDEFHQKDPEAFARTAQTAYFIDPKQLLSLHKELRHQSEEIRIIYHSHINTHAYFSEEDKRLALYEGQPLYPDVDYAVISVIDGETCEVMVFEWDVQLKDFKPKSHIKF